MIYRECRKLKITHLGSSFKFSYLNYTINIPEWVWAFFRIFALLTNLSFILSFRIWHMRSSDIDFLTDIDLINLLDFLNQTNIFRLSFFNFLKWHNISYNILKLRKWINNFRPINKLIGKIFSYIGPKF